jgi:CRP-like cAMP-binding protein
MNGPPADETWPPGSLLGRLAPQAARDLLIVGRGKSYPPSTRLITEGATDRHAVLILGGWVMVLAWDENGHEVMLALRGRGDLVGEMTALGGHTRSAEVITASAVTARLISHQVLGHFLNTHVGVALEVTAMVSDRLRWANRRRLDFRSLSAPARVCRVLVELAHAVHGPEDGSVTTVPITQADLGSIAGVAINTVERTLRVLAANGLVVRGYRLVGVPDPAELAAFSRRTHENP